MEILKCLSKRVIFYTFVLVYIYKFPFQATNKGKSRQGYPCLLSSCALRLYRFVFSYSIPPKECDALFDCFADCNIPYPRLVACERVLIQYYKIGKLSRLNRTLTRLFKIRIRRVACHSLQRVINADALLFANTSPPRVIRFAAHQTVCSMSAVRPAYPDENSQSGRAPARNAPG